MKRELNKKGLSPIISTSILIVIVIILAIIILLWARGFVGEAVIKEIAGNSKRAEDFCKEIGIRTFVNEDDSFGFENSGTIPIFAYNVKTNTAGDTQTFRINQDMGGSVNPGSTVIIDNSVHLDIREYDKYESVKIIPVLLGKVDGSTQEYECPEINGVDV